MNTFSFSIISSLALGPIQLIVEWVVGYFQRMKCLGCDSYQVCPSTMTVKIEWNYRIFLNIMCTLFTVLEGQKVGCVLDSRSRAGFLKNDTAAVHAVRTIQYNHLLSYLLL